MEGQPAEAPLKVCPHCSVASRTDSEACPSCGKPYVRGRTWRWSWWFAIPIVAAAFLIGYFGLSQLFDDEETEGITVEQGRAVPADATRSELPGLLDGEEPTIEGPRPGSPGTTCAYYSITDQPESAWEFCFKGDRLDSSSPVP